MRVDHGRSGRLPRKIRDEFSRDSFLPFSRGVLRDVSAGICRCKVLRLASSSYRHVSSGNSPVYTTIFFLSTDAIQPCSHVAKKLRKVNG